MLRAVCTSVPCVDVRFRAVYLIISTVLFSAVSFAQSISITDFRIPTSKYQRLTGSLYGNWNKANQDNAGVAATSSSNTNSDFSNSINYILGEFSEQRSLQVNASLFSDWATAKTTSDNGPMLNRSSSSSYSATIYPSVSVNYAPYISPDTWFWNFGASGNGQYGYAHNSESQANSTMETSYTGFTRTRNFQYFVSAGVGYGKLRDGQSVFAALRVLDKLNADSVLVRPLNRDEALSLIEVLARQSEYATSQDRYYKFIMEDVFKRLEAMGVLKGGAASVYDVMRAFEVLEYERIEPRLFGWRASAGIARSAQQNRYDSQYGGSFQKDAMEYLRLTSEYGYPLSLNTNLNANASIMIPRQDAKRRIAMSFYGAAVHQVTDRIDTRLAYDFSRSSLAISATDESGFQREVDHNVDWDFTFFIENDVALDASVGYQYRKLNFLDAIVAATSNTYSTYTASIRLTYRFF